MPSLASQGAVSHSQSARCTGPFEVIVGDSDTMRARDPGLLRRQAIQLLLAKPRPQSTVLGAVAFAYFRRLVLHPRRLQGDNVEHLDAYIILGMIGGLMVISQLKVIFGLKVPPGGWSTSMAGQLIQSLEQFRQFHWMPAVVAGIVMLISTLVRMRFPRAPGPFLGVGVAVAAVAVCGLGVTEVGRIPVSLPPFVCRRRLVLLSLLRSNC